MKAEYKVPKPEREVVVTMTETQAIEIATFIGNTGSSDRKFICRELYEDITVYNFFIVLKELVGCR